MDTYSHWGQLEGNVKLHVADKIRHFKQVKNMILFA